MADEVVKAQAAALQAMANPGEPTIFDKILAKQIPSTTVFEDDLCYAFRDINPQAPTHVLVIPKIRAGLTQISKSTPDHATLLGHLMVQASAIGRSECPEGFRLVVNDGAHGAQSVYHLHIHVLGGRQLTWPPG
jgi:diadenosine tetraphosphate (Ap4A) HIT family hydrolase